VRFPLSELKYPLDVYTLSIDTSLSLTNSWEFFASFAMNLNSFSGLTEDSDWGIFISEYPDEWTDPNSLDVFSETDTDMTMIDMEIGFWYRLKTWNKYWFDAGASYMRQSLEFELSNLDQWYPSLDDDLGYESEHELFSGLVGTYGVVYNAVFLNSRLGYMDSDSGSGSILLGLAPLVTADDEDVHLLRDPPVLALGSNTGYGIRASGEYQYDLDDQWFLLGSLSYRFMYLTGRQKNYENDAWVWTTDERIITSQFHASAAVGLNI
jgi:hypothetical protein